MLIPATLLALAMTPAAAGELPPVYQVEVIVFSHLQGQPDRHPVRQLADFSQALVPGDLEVDPDEPAPLRLPGERNDLEGDFRPRPRDYEVVEALSPTMDQAWSRLENSGMYRPLARQAWYQTVPRHRMTRRVRIHDDEVIREDQPANNPIDPILAPTKLNPDETAEPRHWFRTDGSVRFNRRQFYHLALDLEWREPVPDWGTESAGLDFMPEYLVHRVKQSRTIRPDRLEYFDSEWLGVLVLVSRIAD